MGDFCSINAKTLSDRTVPPSPCAAASNEQLKQKLPLHTQLEVKMVMRCQSRSLHGYCIEGWLAQCRGEKGFPIPCFPLAIADMWPAGLALEGAGLT